MDDRQIKLVEALEDFRTDLVRARSSIWGHRHVAEVIEIDTLLSVADSVAMKLQQTTLLSRPPRTGPAPGTQLKPTRTPRT
jgi:hypothetical protein